MKDLDNYRSLLMPLLWDFNVWFSMEIRIKGYAVKHMKLCWEPLISV